MRKYPIYKQDNNYSCGAYCIKMILKYYHLDIETKEIKNNCRLTSEGITVYGMIQCLKVYNIDAKAYQCDLKTLVQEAKLPCIIHIVENNLTHYVVLYQVTKKYLILGDPAKGLYKVKYEEVEKVYSGVCICINHVGRYVVDKEQKDISFQEFIIRHLKNNYQVIIKLVFKAVVIAICSIISSLYFQGLIDMIDKHSYYFIMAFSLGFITVMFIRVIVSYQRQKLEIEVQRRLNHEYVNKTVINMLYLPFKYFVNNEDGVLLTKVQNLYSLSNFFIHLYTAVFLDFILILGLVGTLLISSFFLGMIVIIMLSIMTIIVVKGMKKINQFNKEIINRQEKMNQGYLEYLKNIYNHHQFSMKRFAKEKVNYLFDEYNYHLYCRDSYLNGLNFVSELLIQGLSFVVVLFACYFYKSNLISVGDIIFLYMLSAYLTEPLFNVISFVVEKDEMLILYERYKEIIPDRKKRKIKLKGRIKEIKFDHITYSYGYSKPIFEHLDLVIDKSLWLRGDTGAGKSTLLKLLVKRDDLLKGNILINGIPLAKIDEGALYHKIIYLDKEPLFYHESLRFNLLLENNDESKLDELLSEFGMFEYLDHLEMIIDQEGRPLSSGQRQIMMIIRALLLKPDVLILDEALSNVDDQKAKMILNYLAGCKEIIVIIVAHQTKLVNEFYDCAIIRGGKIYK